MLNKKMAVKLMIGLLSLVILFHLGVVLELISYEVVWAGKLKSKEEMYVFEILSILLNVLLIHVVYIKFQAIKNNKVTRIVDGILWVFVVLFALNTIGNLFATRLLEQVFGTFLTFLSSILCWIIVRKEAKPVHSA